ncbi:MAG TPA: hypothetical protein VNX26_14615 [Candidatus Acidoferrum sp.]|nr:hypothetical protein [Candidatus Acidoferrum sp.]
MSVSATQRSQDAQTLARSPLERLLHALNQPLTGLQCSMEVALASLRTVEYYVERLRAGLELTERMRALVEAIREVADGEAEKNEEPEAIEWKTLVREVMDDLRPVAEVNGVRITLDCSTTCSLAAMGARRKLSSLLFRLLESVVSLADRGSALRIEAGMEAGGAADAVWVRIRWYAGLTQAEFSRPELGLLVAQAGWERAGAKWERERTENLETVTVRLSGVSDGREDF